VGRQGNLVVVKDLRLKEPYTSSVPLQSGEMGEDLAYYLLTSEQIPSAVGLGVFVKTGGEVTAAGGFLIQSLPPAEEQVVDQIIENIRKVPSVTEILRQGQSPEELLLRIFSGIPTHTLDKRDLFLQCACRRERVERILFSLGSSELRKMIDEQGQADVTCEFCRTVHHFSREELEALCREAAPAC
jgi:molecular chaperone Hsp33